MAERLRFLANWLVAKDREMHDSVQARFPGSLAFIDRTMLFFVDKVLSHAIFAIIISLVLLVMGIAGVDIIVLASTAIAWLMAFLWIARSSETLRRLTIVTRLFALLVIGAVLATLGNGLGNWALTRYRQSQAQAPAPLTLAEFSQGVNKIIGLLTGRHPPEQPKAKTQPKKTGLPPLETASPISPTSPLRVQIGGMSIDRDASTSAIWDGIHTPEKMAVITLPINIVNRSSGHRAIIVFQAFKIVPNRGLTPWLSAGGGVEVVGLKTNLGPEEDTNGSIRIEVPRLYSDPEPGTITLYIYERITETLLTIDTK